MRYRKGGRPRRWTDETALAALAALAQRLGRVPSARDCREAGTAVCPCSSLLRQRFGTFSDAVRMIGLEPRKSGGQPGLKGVEKRRFTLLPIDPEKAQSITEAKRDYWLNGGRGRLGRSEWVHPYARRRTA